MSVDLATDLIFLLIDPLFVTVLISKIVINGHRSVVNAEASPNLQRPSFEIERSSLSEQALSMDFALGIGMFSGVPLCHTHARSVAPWPRHLLPKN
jgi:hypothetical protein